MPMPSIMLTEGEVPLGSRVHLYVPGMDMPEQEDGTPLVLRAMEGGVPTRKKLYPLPHGVRHSKDYVVGSGLEGFAEGMLFSPIEVYTPEQAPIGKDYVVFVDGKRMEWWAANLDGTRASHKISPRVSKREDGNFRQVMRNPPDFKVTYGNQKVPLPDGAELVPVD